MAVYALRQVRALAARLLEHVVAAYDAAVHLVEEHLAPVLPRLSDLAASDDHGVLLEQAQNLLRGRDLLLSEDAANRLVDAPARSGEQSGRACPPNGGNAHVPSPVALRRRARPAPKDRKSTRL